jgi:hypothetical protein
VHRLGAEIEVAVGLDLPQFPDDVRLEAVVHGQVGMVPVAQHAQADEVGLLAFHLARRVFPAQFPEAGRRRVLAVGLFHLQFDGQAVAVPARHVGRVEALQGLGLDDDVLEDLVHRVADVDVAVGVGRAVMQHPDGAALGVGAQLFVELLLLPGLDPGRFPLGEVAAHGEGGVGEVEGVFVVGHFGFAAWISVACAQAGFGRESPGGELLFLLGQEK